MTTDYPAFEIPEHPIDQFEVKLFKVSDHGDRVDVVEVRYVYHVNTTWKSLYPGDVGADFEDVWQIFEGDRFVARSNNGWRSIFDAHVPGTYCTSLSEAKKIAINKLLERLQLLTQKKVVLKQQLEELGHE